MEDTSLTFSELQPNLLKSQKAIGGEYSIFAKQIYGSEELPHSLWLGDRN